VLKQIINQEQSDKSPKKDAPAASLFLDKQQSSPTSSPNMSGSKNILSSDVEIKGNIKFANDLIMDGQLIEGAVISDGDLTVGENATINGEIQTRSVTVFGVVKGNITATDLCELKQNAELHGDVTAGKLAIEEGAIFMGSSTVGAAASAVAKNKPAPSAPASKPAENSGGGENKPNPEGGGNSHG
jgi:cytoskeletal protein CcmA (bactofilin family)